MLGKLKSNSVTVTVTKHISNALLVTHLWKVTRYSLRYKILEFEKNNNLFVQHYKNVMFFNNYLNRLERK